MHNWDVDMPTDICSRRMRTPRRSYIGTVMLWGAVLVLALVLTVLLGESRNLFDGYGQVLIEYSIARI